jgi:hypothetical protein
MGVFNLFKKNKDERNTKTITITPEQYIHEVNFMLRGASIVFSGDAIVKDVIDKRKVIMEKPELYSQYIDDIHKLVVRIINLLPTTVNVPISDIIQPMACTDNYLNAAVTCAYYSGQCDEYNLFLKSCLPMLPPVSITVQQQLSEEEVISRGLNYVLTSTDQGKAMYAFVNRMGSTHEEFLQDYFDKLNDMLSMHERNRELLYVSSDAVDRVNAAFSDSICGNALLKEEFKQRTEEILLLSCIYLIARLRADYNMTEMFNEAINL